jgi:hypothetical protein
MERMEGGVWRVVVGDEREGRRDEGRCGEK